MVGREGNAIGRALTVSDLERMAGHPVDMATVARPLYSIEQYRIERFRIERTHKPPERFALFTAIDSARVVALPHIDRWWPASAVLNHFSLSAQIYISNLVA